MAHYLADTSLIIDLINDQRHRGLCRNEEGRRKLTAHWFDQFSYHDVTLKIAQDAGALLYQWRRKGKTRSLADATIAAVAIHYDLVLPTDNERHFPMPELMRHSLPPLCNQTF